MLNKHLNSGNYCLRNSKFISIKSLILSLNKKLIKKIKVKFLSDKRILNSRTKYDSIKNIYTKDNVHDFLLKKLTDAK